MQPKPHPMFDNTPPADEATKPKKRQKDRLHKAKEALTTFRFLAKSRYLPPTSFIASVILPDRILNALAANIDIKTPQDLEEAAGMEWVFAGWNIQSSGTPGSDGDDNEVVAGVTLFDKALDVVQALDSEWEEARDAVKRARTEKSHAEAERKRIAAEEKAREKAERDRIAQEEREEAARVREELEEQRLAEQAALGFHEFNSSSSPTPWVVPTEAPLAFQYEVCG